MSRIAIYMCNVGSWPATGIEGRKKAKFFTVQGSEIGVFESRRKKEAKAKAQQGG